MHNDALAQGWTDLLCARPWHWFCTLTFDPKRHGNAQNGVHPEKAAKAWRWWIANLNSQLYGKRWHQHDSRGVQWALGQEFHKDGRLHFHGLVASDCSDLNRLASRVEWKELWFREFGRARIERPTSIDEVCGYVSKYVSKDGQVDISDNFNRFLPPALFTASERVPGSIISGAVFTGNASVDDNKLARALANIAIALA